MVILRRRAPCWRSRSQRASWVNAQFLLLVIKLWKVNIRDNPINLNLANNLKAIRGISSKMQVESLFPDLSQLLQEIPGAAGADGLGPACAPGGVSCHRRI